MGKRCSKCGKIKKYSCFYKYADMKDGYRNECKKCWNKHILIRSRTKEGLVTKIYSQQRSKSKKRGMPNPSYTKKELQDWLFSQKKFHILFDNWKRLDYQTSYIPSVDRKNDYLGYTMSNIQIMTWDENNKKAHSDMQNGKNTKYCKSIKQFTLGGEYIMTFFSIKNASLSTGVNELTIGRCCKGKQKTAGGFKWRYTDDWEATL